MFLLSKRKQTNKQNKRLRTPWTADWMHTGQDRWIQTEMVFTLAKNATKPNPFEIISLQTTRKKNNWKTEGKLGRTVVTLETERIKGSNPWCWWWWWWWRWESISSESAWLVKSTSVSDIVLLPCDSRDGHSDPHLRIILFVLGEMRCCLSYSKSRHEVACSIEGKIRRVSHGLLHLKYTTRVCRITTWVSRCWVSRWWVPRWWVSRWWISRCWMIMLKGNIVRTWGLSE